LKLKKLVVIGYDVLSILGDSHREPSSAKKNICSTDILTGFMGIIFI